MQMIIIRIYTASRNPRNERSRTPAFPHASIPAHQHCVRNVHELEALNGAPGEGVKRKVLARIYPHARRFIARSPFLLLATGSATGTDCSPRGDTPGFVQVIDETTLLIPERPGNRRADSLRNVVAHPSVGLLLLIPGMDETLRINGDAYVVRDERLLERFKVGAKAPTLGLWVNVKESYFHCAKAFIRSKLWDPTRHMDRKEFPSLGTMVLDQINGAPAAPELVQSVDASLAQDYRNNLY